MNELQKEQVTRMRQEGSGYSRIAQSLAQLENTVKSYCKRNAISRIGAGFPHSERTACRNCGKLILVVRAYIS